MGVIIITENRETLSLARSYLSDIWEEIVGYTLGILSNSSALVSTDRIKISENSNAPRIVRNPNIL